METTSLKLRESVREVYDSKPSFFYRELRKFSASALVTSFAILLLSAFLMPFAFMLTTAFKNYEQLSLEGAPIWPAMPETYTYEGVEYPLYEMPAEVGSGQWALVKKGQKESTFIDPANPDAGLIQWEGRWRTLTPAFRG
jgi:multiple sugar transport system permease protein